MRCSGRWSWAYGLLGWLLMLAGCASVEISTEGRETLPEARIALSDAAEGGGMWEGRDLWVSFDWVRSGDALNLSGTVGFFKPVADGFAALSEFTLRVHLLDADGRVISTAGVATAAYRKPITPLTFERRVTISPETNAMAFSYSGRAIEGGGDGRPGSRNDGISWEFWQVPFP